MAELLGRDWLSVSQSRYAVAGLGLHMGLTHDETQSHCVPVPVRPSPVVSQSWYVPVPLCPSPIASQSHCVPFPWALHTMGLVNTGTAGVVLVPSCLSPMERRRVNTGTAGVVPSHRDGVPWKGD